MAARTSQRGDYITLALVAWTLAGALSDIWAHGQGLPETFFNPYHAVFYSGYLVTAAWLLWPALATGRGGQDPLGTGRPGYGPAQVGVGIFAVGGLGDAIWHSAFGIERGIDIFTSPPHILLFAGLALMASGPLYAAWIAPGPQRPALRALLPALLSAAMVLLVVHLATLHMWGPTSSRFMSALAIERITREFVATERAAVLVREIATQRAVANLLLTTLTLLAPTLLLIHRWRLPAGSLTVVVGLVTWLMDGVTGMFFPWIALAGLLGAAAGDGLVRALAPAPTRPKAFRTFAVVFPMTYWGLYLLAVHLHWGVAWTPALWAGVVLWTGAVGFGASLLVLPPTGAALVEPAR
ncbi:MAG: hypothetical protein QN159_10595 [Armatimonadota bacterium]|nr:hypothetical protein [Armatimonadota bacterium]